MVVWIIPVIDDSVIYVMLGGQEVLRIRLPLRVEEDLVEDGV